MGFCLVSGLQELAPEPSRLDMQLGRPRGLLGAAG